MSKSPAKSSATFEMYNFQTVGRRVGCWQRALRKLLKILPYKCATAAAVQILFECGRVRGRVKKKNWQERAKTRRQGEKKLTGS